MVSSGNPDEGLVQELQEEILNKAKESPGPKNQ
jgi:hypothetical protein